MTEYQFETMNNQLYDSGKIKEDNRGLMVSTYTSDLWESLKLQGYTIETFKGLCNITDNNNCVIIQAVGKINALWQLAILFR